MAFMIKSLVFVTIVSYALAQTTTISTEEAARLKAAMIAMCKRNVSPDLTTDEEEWILVKRQVPKTKTGACFTACVLKNVNYMAPNNSMIFDNLHVRLDRTRDLAPPEEYPKKIQLLNYCKSKETPEPDQCVAAKNFVDCCVNKKVELNITTKLW